MSRWKVYVRHRLQLAGKNQVQIFSGDEANRDAILAGFYEKKIKL